MKLTALTENTAPTGLECEHGLSLYIETAKHSLLFDTGASGMFARNAEKLGVDLARVELAVLSHGHYDHGGGLSAFLALNGGAKVYVHEKAFEKHCSYSDGDRRDIGLDKTLLPNGRFVFCGGPTVIAAGIELFSGVAAKRLVPLCNADLFKQAGEELVPDDFAHEQNLILTENGRTILISGCAHNGIVNILDSFYAWKGRYPDVVIGGFHLYSVGVDEDEDPAMVDEIAACLLQTGAQCYTCHCTGLTSYRRLKETMGDRVRYLSTGDVLEW